MASIFSLFLAAIVALLPILGWAYMFSYMDNEPLHARRFVSGMILGAVSVVPVAFMPNILAFLHLESFQVFSMLSISASWTETVLAFMLFLASVLCIVGAMGFVAQGGAGFGNRRVTLSVIASFCLIVPAFFILLALLNPPSSGSVQVSIAGATLAGFASIAMAYFVVGGVEEAWKYFGLFGSCPSDHLKQRGLLLAVFVALGFAFFENILYIFHLLRDSGSVFGIWISRSLVSVAIHVVSSVIAIVPVIRFLRSENTSSLPVIPFFTGLLLAVLFHASFDIAMSYGKIGFITIYALFGYFIVTKAFYRDVPVEE